MDISYNEHENILMHNYISDLLQKYVSGKISSNEFTELKRYINLTPDKDLFFLLQQQWENKDSQTSVSTNDIERITEYIHLNTASRKSSLMHRVGWLRVGVAALFLLLIGLSLYLYLGKQEYVRLGERDFVMRTGKGERVSMVLPDGTLVRLNSESALSYQQNFGHNSRSISFTGEGYFEVAKDVGKQFEIHTRHLNVKVLGTTFNLSVYEEDKTMELALLSGMVEISTNHDPTQIAALYPNEKALFDTETKQLSIEKTFDQSEIAWIENKLIFRSEPLREVLKQIGRKYGLSIEMQIQELEEDRYTGVFHEDINGVLNTLKVHYGFEYEIVNDTLYITREKK